MRRHRIRTAALLVLLLALAGCGSDSGAGTSSDSSSDTDPTAASVPAQVSCQDAASLEATSLDLLKHAYDAQTWEETHFRVEKSQVYAQLAALAQQKCQTLGGLGNG
jgi:hypothetical protein